MQVNMKKEVIPPRVKGKQNLRFNVLLFSLWTVVYVTLILMSSHYLTKTTFLILPIHAQAIGVILMWIVMFVQLWNYRKKGRVWFLLYTLFHLLTLYECYLLFQSPLKQQLEQPFRLALSGCVLAGNLMNLHFLKHLYGDVMIACLWNEAILYEDETDSEDVRELPTAPAVKETRLEKKAKAVIRGHAALLAIYIYGSLVLIYFLMFLIMYYHPEDQDGLEYVQRMFLLATLFTALIWSLPLASMMLYRRWTKYIIPIMAILEGCRLIYVIPQIYDAFATQQYLIPSLLSLLIIETLRYTLLAKIILRILRNPFVRTYWGHKYHKENSRQDQTE